MHVSFTGAGRDALDAALARAPDHFRPLFKAVRDEGCGLTIVGQGRERFAPGTDRPQLVVISDDMAAALGPNAFHARSLRRYLPRCGAAVVMACQPLPALYWEASSWAALRRRDVLIVETRPEREADWLDLIRAEAPADVALGLGTTAPAGRA